MATTRNYTTTIAAGRTVGEIQDMLARHGARTISVQYDTGVPIAITCVLPTPIGDRTFRLAARIDGTQRRLEHEHMAGRVRRGLATREQAARVIWRTIQDWLEATVELIEAEAATMDQALFAYLLPEHGEQTIYEEYIAREQRLLPRLDEEGE